MDFSNEIVSFVSHKVGGIVIIAEGSDEIVYADSYFMNKYGAGIVGMDGTLIQTQKSTIDFIQQCLKKRKRNLRFICLQILLSIWDLTEMLPNTWPSLKNSLHSRLRY